MLTYTINIYSNDGQTTLASYSLEDSFKMTIYITEKGIEQDGAKLPSILYGYDGKNIFEGVALTANNKTTDYSVKSDFTVSDSDVNLYVVESSGAKAPAPDSCYIYVDGVRITYISGEDVSGSAITVTSAGVSQFGSLVYTASDTISGMEIITGSASEYIGTVINVGETVGDGTIQTYSYGLLASYSSGYFHLYLTPVYASTSNDYTITQTLTNITSDSATITITPDTGYTLPSSITVLGATLTSYNSNTGVAVLSNMTNNVSVEVECEEIVENPYLTFSSPNTFTLAIANSTKNWDGTLEYSTNTTSWSTWDGTSAISAASDGTTYNLYMRGSNNTAINPTHMGYFVITGSNVSCSGNIENILDYSTVSAGNQPTLGTYCFAWLFYNCTALISAPELPSVNLGNGCYYAMFKECSNLVTGPSSLPAISLSALCYYHMFVNCTSLQNVPDMTINTLPNFVYQDYGVCLYMFYGCSSITDASNIHLNATTLYDYCYYGIFSGCTSLTTAPALPATTLASYCYFNMFYGCTRLTTPPALPATTLADYCYQQMFYGCTSLTTVPALPATTLAVGCYAGMFYGCTSLTTVPALSATALQRYCYFSMFQNCTKIKMSTTYSNTYPNSYRIPTSGNGTMVVYALQDMFTSTGGTFTGEPTINTTYYTSNTVIPATTS